MTAAAVERPFKRWCRRCGWTGAYKSAARADDRKRRHSCERHLRAKGARLRREFREAMVDRTPKPCRHKIAEHVHGTYACYVADECRCPPCAAANRTYEAQRTRQQAYGRWNGLVDAEPARRHVRRLMEQGMGLKRIVEVGGASQGQLWKLLYGKKHPDGTRTPSRRIRPDVANRLLAIELDLADGARVDGTLTTRRIQALVANGWSQSKLAARLGVLPGNFLHIAHGRRDVTVATARAVHALYRELVDQAPPEETQRDKIAASRARREAREHGWAPPLRIAGRPWIGSAFETPDPAYDDNEAAS